MEALKSRKVNFSRKFLVGRQRHHHDAFTTGWRKLPDELKIMVLEYLFLERSRPYAWYEQCVTKDDKLFIQEWPLSLLHSTKELAPLAKEVFYGKCCFFVNTKEGIRTPIRYPRPTVNHLIRQLHIHMAVRCRDWLFVEKLARGHFGFGKLCDVIISVWGNNIPDNQWANTHLLDRMDTQIIFKVKSLTIMFMEPLPLSRGLVPSILATHIQPKFLENVMTRLDEVENEPKKRTKRRPLTKIEPFRLRSRYPSPRRWMVTTQSLGY